jgi:hypothetical protein
MGTAWAVTAFAACGFVGRRIGIHELEVRISEERRCNRGMAALADVAPDKACWKGLLSTQRVKQNEQPAQANGTPQGHGNTIVELL